MRLPSPAARMTTVSSLMGFPPPTRFAGASGPPLHSSKHPAGDPGDLTLATISSPLPTLRLAIARFTAKTPEHLLDPEWQRARAFDPQARPRVQEGQGGGVQGDARERHRQPARGMQAVERIAVDRVSDG